MGEGILQTYFLLDFFIPSWKLTNPESAHPSFSPAPRVCSCFIAGGRKKIKLVLLSPGGYNAIMKIQVKLPKPRNPYYKDLIVLKKKVCAPKKGKGSYSRKSRVD
jgi:hypothetical protein